MEKEMEFREMKEQLRTLQERLDHQVEINEKQLKKAIGEGINGLRRRDRRELFFCVFAAFFVTGIAMSQELTPYFICATFIFLMLNAAWKYYLKFGDKEMSSMDMVETSKQLLLYKERSRKSLIYGLPIALVWAIWYMYEISQTFGLTERSQIISLILTCSLGGLFGGIIGYLRFYRPSMATADRLLNQIKELKGE